MKILRGNADLQIAPPRLCLKADADNVVFASVLQQSETAHSRQNVELLKTTYFEAFNSNSKKNRSISDSLALKFNAATTIHYSIARGVDEYAKIIASQKADRIVVGAHGDDGKIFLTTDDKVTNRISTVDYLNIQLKACKDSGHIPKELFIFPCEGASEIDPQKIKDLSRIYPNVKIIISPTVNYIYFNNKRLYGEYYQFKNGEMTQSEYYNLQSIGHPHVRKVIRNGLHKDENYKHWREQYKQALDKQ